MLPIKNFMLVCGPKGSGKSTFMRRLSASELPEVVGTLIPSGAENWVQLESRGPFFFPYLMDISAQKSIPGVVVHLDFTRMLRGDDYWDSLAALILRAQDILIITLIIPGGKAVGGAKITSDPDPKKQKQTGWGAIRLAATYARSTIFAIMEHVPRKWIVYSGLLYSIIRACNALNARAKGPRKVMPEQVSSKRELDIQYQNQIRCAEKQCSDFLCSLGKEGRFIRKIVIEPDVNKRCGDLYPWRIVRTFG